MGKNLQYYQSLHIRQKTMRQRKRGAVRAKIDLLYIAIRGKNEWYAPENMTANRQL